MTEGIKSNDTQLKKVASQMSVIDEGVQNYVLKKLLARIQILVNISGFIQRVLNSDTCDQTEAEKLVWRLQNETFTCLEEFKDPQKTISEETREKSMIDLETLQRLNLVDMEPNPDSGNIESFSEIGWLDPFPIESTQNLKDFVEDLKTSFIEVKKIKFLTLPSRAMMIQIMRACIGVKDPEDLWI